MTFVSGLTQNAVSRLKFDRAGPSVQIRWDDKVPGLGARVYPSGKRSYLIDYRDADGLKRRSVLGPANVMALAQARDKAREQLSALRMTGADPLKEKRAAQLQRWGDYRKSYIQHIEKKGNKAWKDQDRLLERMTARWDSRNIGSISRQDVAALHHKIGTDQPGRPGTPYLANRLLSYLSHAFNIAVDIASYPEQNPNPARRIKRFKETSRRRRVELEELPTLFAAIEAEPNRVAANYLKLILFTGMRRSEALSARWRYWDKTRKVLVLPDTKQGEPHAVPLNTLAVELLKGIKRTRGNPYIFATDSGHLVNPDKAWRRIRVSAGMPDLRIHDLRRSVGSLMAESNKSLHIIGAVLGHKKPATTAIYARLGHKPAADALQEYGDQIFAVIDGGRSD